MGRHQLRLLRFVLDYPGWHTLGTSSPNERRACYALRDLGLVEVVTYEKRGVQPQFRARQPKSAPVDLSGGDPGYCLIDKSGPVLLTLETANGIETKAAFATIADAERYISISTTIDPIDRDAGRYGIDAPESFYI